MDSQLTSSSSSRWDRTATYGRLNNIHPWCASPSDSARYLTVDLLQTMSVTGIALQGDNPYLNWVTKFKLQYSFDGTQFKDVYTRGHIVIVSKEAQIFRNVFLIYLAGP